MITPTRATMDSAINTLHALFRIILTATKFIVAVAVDVDGIGVDVAVGGIVGVTVRVGVTVAVGVDVAVGGISNK